MALGELVNHVGGFVGGVVVNGCADDSLDHRRKHVLANIWSYLLTDNEAEHVAHSFLSDRWQCAVDISCLAEGGEKVL